jgi:hypothetical protein
LALIKAATSAFGSLLEIRAQTEVRSKPSPFELGAFAKFGNLKIVATLGLRGHRLRMSLINSVDFGDVSTPWREERVRAKSLITSD